VDRMGKGIRTAPRDALISLSSPGRSLGLAFGVHRALDTCGAMLGPLIAFAVLPALPNAFDLIFIASFCAAVVGVGVLGLFVENRAPRMAALRANPVAWRGAFGLLRGPGFRGLVVAGGVLAVAATVGPLELFVALLLFGAYYAATDGVLMALASEVLTADLRTSGMALLSTATGLARLLASLTFGAIWAWWGAEVAATVFLIALITA